MPSILICAARPLREELRGTLLWRNGNVHHLAATLDEALTKAVALHPDLIVVDRDLEGAQSLVESVRREVSIRSASIVVAAPGDITDTELELLESGANAVIRLPAGSEWDDRLSSLMHVPPRRATRVPLRFDLYSAGAAGTRWATGLNLSETGMLVELEGKLPIGSRLDMRFYLPHSDSPIECTAHVVREDEPGRYGIRFEKLGVDSLRQIRSFVAVGNTTERRIPARASDG